MLLSLSLLFSICASFAFLNGRVFSVLGHSFERHKWSFVLYIVSFYALKISFSKLSLAKYHCLCKNHNIFYAINASTTERLYKSLFYKFFCANLSQVVLRRFYTERFVQYDLCNSYLFNLFISYNSEKTELIRSFKNRIIHISMQKVAMISQFTVQIS